MITALLVIAILVVLIIVHEFGHFVAAKIFGVRVEEFGVGYPPRAFTFGKVGDTEYTLNWIPFGGFVRLFGDEGEAERGRGSLVDSPRWKQAVILVAGVAMNAAGAWALFAVALHIGVPTAVDSVPAGQHARLLISDVVAGSPAAAAGLEAGDEITGVADAKGTRIIDTLSPDTVVAFVSARGGKPVTVSFIHQGKEESATVTPANAVVPGAAGRPALGIALSLVMLHTEPWGQAAVDALHETGNGLVMVAGNLWYLISSALRGAPDFSGIVGPVGIVSYVGQASQNGFGSVLLLAGLISANLVIINLIPIPALDGGRLLFVIIESVIRRPIKPVVAQALNGIGFVALILLMLVVTAHDIFKIVG